MYVLPLDGDLDCIKIKPFKIKKMNCRNGKKWRRRFNYQKKHKVQLQDYLHINDERKGWCGYLLLCGKENKSPFMKRYLKIRMIFWQDIEFNATNVLHSETENKCDMRNVNRWKETKLVNEKQT